MAKPIGFTTPFVKSPTTLGLLGVTYTELDATLNNLRALLLTNWGERPNHDKLGCNLIEFIFEPMGDDVKERMTQRITDQVTTWLPFVVLNKIDIQFGRDASQIFVTIDFSLAGKQDKSSTLVQTLTLGV